jgi:hypothetical protein
MLRLTMGEFADSNQLCPNLYFLGKRSTTKTSEGVKIVTLGGQLDDKIVAGLSQDKFLPFHTVGDAKALWGSNSADILLTTSWPASIRTGSKIALPATADEPTGHDHISDLVSTLKPRYHFATSPGFFFEREPFFYAPSQDAPGVRPVTRFISLAAHGNLTKQKAMYAFSLTPKADPTAALPANATASPFVSRTGSKKRSALDPEPFSRFGGHNNHHGGKRRRRNEPPPGPEQCFFCLSNPSLATHLISSIGNDSYLTTAKGPLTTSATNSNYNLDFPAHILIIPLTHASTLALNPDADSRESTYAEMQRYHSALQSMVASRSSGKLGSVTYEVSRANGVHTHWQFHPIPTEMITKGLVEGAFRIEAENLSYPTFTARDPGIGLEEGDFFRVWIWSPSKDDETKAKGTEVKGITKCLTLPLNDDFRFDLQFGRRVLAKLLGLEKRLQWRDCAQEEEEEKADVEAFKAAFKPWDFSLEE